MAASKSMRSAELLHGLNIKSVGETAAKALGVAYPRLVPELQRASWQEIKAASGGLGRRLRREQWKGR